MTLRFYDSMSISYDTIHFPIAKETGNRKLIARNFHVTVGRSRAVRFHFTYLDLLYSLSALYCTTIYYFVLRIYEYQVITSFI